MEGTWKRRELKDRKRTLNKYLHLTKRGNKRYSLLLIKKKKYKFKDILIYKIHKTKRRSKDNFGWVEKALRRGGVCELRLIYLIKKSIYNVSNE